MIRILHCVDSMNRGGIETLLMNIYRNLDRNKIQFDFMVHTNAPGHYDEEIKQLGGRIFSVTPRNQGVLKNRKSIHQIFKDNNYKILHQHVSSLTYISPLSISKKYNVPVRIVHSHNTKQSGSILHRLLHKYNQIFIKSIATHYFACSNLAAKWLYPKKQYLNGQYTIIYNAIDIDKFRYNKTARERMREQLGITNNFVLGHIGRFTHQKNHSYLIDIFKIISDLDSKATLILVGEGKLQAVIKEKVRKFNLTEKVLFLGVRKDIPELLQAIDVFVMPSYHEGLPVTLVEAQAASLPCVLSTKITKEVEMLNAVKWCNLEDKVNIWAEQILGFRNYTNRENEKIDEVKTNYDIRKITNNIEKIYIKCLKDIEIKS